LLTSGVVCNFDLSDDPTGTTKTNDQIHIVGDLSITGTNTFQMNLLNSDLAFGTYNLITYTGSFTGNISNIKFTGTGIYGKKYTVNNNDGVISITIQATRAPAKITWSGTGTDWDIVASSNWILNGLPEVFVANDTVVFNAIGAAKPSVNITNTMPIGAMTVDASSNDYTFAGSGLIGGAGGLTKTGNGTLTISTANTFTGKVAINGGTLQIGSIANAGSASPIGASTDTVPGQIIFSNAKINFTGSGTGNSTDRGITLSGIDTINISKSATARLAIKGRMDGTGKLVKTGSGILMFQPATSMNTYSGGTVIKAGTLSLGNDVANANGLGTGTVTLDGGTLTMTNTTSSYTSSTLNMIVPFGSSGTFNADGRVELYGSLTGGGTLNYYTPYLRTTLHQDMTAFTGQINATGSDFRLANTSGYATVSINLASGVTAYYNTSNGYANSTQNVTVGELSGVAGSKIQDENWTVGIKNTDASFNGTISGASITKEGTGSWTLTGANTYTGSTTVNAGTLIVNNTSGSGTGTGAVTINTGATLAGNGTISGAVTVTNGGTIAPGNNGVGTLTINSNLILAAGSTAAMEINKSAASDTIRLTGNLTYNGTLAIANIGTSTFAAGESYKLFSATSYNGSFSTITPSTPGTGMVWDTTTLRTRGAIRVKGNQTLSFEALANKTYGDAVFTLTGMASSGLPVTYTSSDTSVVTISENTATIVGAGNAIITASQAGDTAYLPAVSVDQPLLVNQASQTIAFETLPTKQIGDPGFSPEATASSGLPVTYSSSNFLVAVVLNNNIYPVWIGTSIITASQAGNKNYRAATPVNQTLTVTRKSQTITFPALPTKKVGDANFAPGATASSDFPVTYTSSNTKVATIVGYKIHVVGIGTSTITASQEGNLIYSAAASVSNELVVVAKTTKSAVDMSVSLEQSSPAMVAYPNPVSDILSVEMSGVVSDNPTIYLYNENGLMLLSRVVSNTKEYIDVKGMPAGIYFLKLIDGNQVINLKVIKQ
jgi:autotransporter-associated beta strand protein